jgi:hypothetical protein
MQTESCSGNTRACLCFTCNLFVVYAVIEPMTAEARLRFCMKPEQKDFKIPKILASVVFEQIVVALSKNQVCKQQNFTRQNFHFC